MTLKLLLAAVSAVAALASGASELDEVFARPPAASGIYTWWHWQGGNVTKYGITRDLESMKRAGVAGATIFNIQDVGWDSKFRFERPLCEGMEYMNRPWFEMLAFAVSEAKRLGLVLGLHNCPGYSTSGGPWITPALGMKKLVWAKEGEAPETVLGFYRDIARVETTNGVYRFGYTCTGKCTHPSPPEMEKASLEADKMSLAAIDAHLDHLLDNLKTHGITASNPGLSFVLMDSYEAEDSSWTDDFATEFIRRRGYDPIPFLPVMAGMGTAAGAARDEQFRHDFQRTKNELQTERHYKRFHERLNAAGYEFHLEPYFGPFDGVEAAQHCDVPMTEFWEGCPHWGKPVYPGGSTWHQAPVARALGRNITGAEAFTGYPLADPFALTPRDLKRGLDATFARGVNRLSLHHWVHQPLDAKWKPGLSMGPWGTHFGENQTWFEPGLPFYRYMHRVQAMMQTGTMRSDDLGISHAFDNDSDVLPYSGFLTNTIVTAAGKIRVLSSGREYSILTLHPEMAVREAKPVDAVEHEVFRKVQAFRKAGIPICADDDKARARAQIGLAPLFEARGVADRNTLLANAREVNGTAFWFVANIDTNAVACEVSLRLLPTSGATIESWDAETGEKLILPGFAVEKGVAKGSLRLPRESAVFLVCRPQGEPAPNLPCFDGARRPTGEALPVGTTGWTLTFAPGGGAPTDAVALHELKPWTAFEEEGIRYFSGTGTYETRVTVPRDGVYELDLGEVNDLAEVFVDGRYAMTLWHRPYRRELKLAAGERRLTVKVTNAWTNRLAGDEKKPADCRYGEDSGFNNGKTWIPIGNPVIAIPDAIRSNGERTSGRLTYSSWRYLLSDADLRPAGLLGPVVLRGF